MSRSRNAIDVYLEIGSQRTIAGVIDWPGWCRAGRDEESALQALVDYGTRYGRVAHAAHLAFRAPGDTSALRVVERLKGSATTDFGAPDAVPSGDTQALDDGALRRSRALLKAGWRAFDAAVAAAQGTELRKGPRGGGRDLEGIVGHVLGADGSYVSRLAWKHKRDEDATLDQQLADLRAAILEALHAGARGELPRQGPRGGAVWPARFFVRRSLWHLLDHIWEIEDRAGPEPRL